MLSTERYSLLVFMYGLLKKTPTFNWTDLDICNIPIKELKNTETFPCVLSLFSIINSLIRPMGILVNVEDLE